MEQHDYDFETEQLARDFVERALQEHSADVAFFRSGLQVRVFNGTTKSIESSLEHIYNTIATVDGNPRRTRRISSTGVHAVKLSPAGKP